MKREERHLLTLDARRKDLILATLESIRKHGFINSTIKTISEESGLSRGLISHYFGSKDELLLAAFRHLTENIDEFYRQNVYAVNRDPFEKLLATAMVPFRQGNSNMEIWLHFWSAALMKPDFMAVHRDLWSRYRAFIQRQMTEAAKERNLDIDVKVTALIYTQLIDGLSLGRVLEKSYDADSCCKIMRDWLCQVFKEDPSRYPLVPDRFPKRVGNTKGPSHLPRSEASKKARRALPQPKIGTTN